MRRPVALLVSGLFALSVLAAGFLNTTSGVSAATTIAPTTYCGNSILNVGGKGLICEVTVVNTITGGGGSATVTVKECQGAADAETACTTKTLTLTKQVTGVNQCNGSTNGGGGTLRCKVTVTNNFIGLNPTVTAATVNQCVGSGESGVAGDSIFCDPFPASTTNATITQCNGSANGGTLVELRCTADGTKPSNHKVRINQCNDSGNGGGALVICSANITNHVLQATPAPSATPVPSPAPSASAAPTATPGRATPRPTLPRTNTEQLTAQPGGADLAVAIGVMFLVAMSALVLLRRKPARLV